METVNLLSSDIVDSKLLENDKVVMNTILEKYSTGSEFKKHEIILPRISDIELTKRYNKIEPIVEEEGIYYFLKRFSIYELRDQSYIWDQASDKRDIADLTNATVVSEFTCYHTCGYYGIFRPSIDEVLSQFPDEALKEANAFFMYESPETMEDLRKQWDIVEAHCHRSKVRALSLRK